MKPKVFFSLTLIAIILTSIFSPAVMASTVYGPVQYEQGNGTPVEVNDSFSLNDTHGNYTLFLKNSDGEINRSSRASVLLNGKTVVVPEDFKQRIGMIQGLSLSPGDLKNVGLIQKNVSLESENNLNVKMKSAPGSRMTLWIEDETSPIKIVSPYEDSVSNGTVNVSGSIDSSITSEVNLICNGVSSPLPIENGNFSTEVNITGPTNITVSGIDSAGMMRSATLLLDGDMLMASEEHKLGFDPLNPDSDSSLTSQNEAGNGVLDGLETFGDQLPSFVKSRIGADPLVNDTDSDGLTDNFELMELGLLTDVRSGDSDGNGITDAQADPDNDGLTNLQEQANGTDPLSPDHDRDGLTDPQELAAGTNPRLEDTDNDGLSDGSELRLGTNPLNPDSDGDGVPDGQETYTSLTNNSTLGVTVAVTATGDAAQNVSIANETSPYYTEISAIAGPVVDILLNETFTNATVTLSYDPAKFSDYQNLGLFTYNETLGTFVQIPATVDPVAHTMTATTNHFSIYTIFHIPTWNNLFSTPMNFGTQPPQDGPWQVTFSHTNLRTGSARWFNSGTEFPAGSYRITAYGDYNLNPVSTQGDWWRTGAMKAWETYSLDGIWVLSGTEYNPTAENPISFLTVDHYEGSGSTRSAILVYNHPGGPMGLRLHEEMGPLSNNCGSLLYRLEYTGDTDIDDDDDGLSDLLETTGFRDGRGKWYRTNPNNNDTDSDGLNDSVEAGQLLANVGGMKYYKVVSDPTKVDGDDDRLTDPEELSLGTDPFNPDTDLDGIPDSVDEYPLIPAGKEIESSILEIGRAIILGAVFGESGLEGGLAAGYVDEEISYSPYYLLGWIGFGLIPVAGAVADARDAVQAFINGDELGVALNAAGIFSGIGDGVKTTFAVGLFVKKTGKVAEVAKMLAKYLLPKIPNTMVCQILDPIFEGAASALYNVHKVPTHALLELADKSVDLRRVEALLANVYNKWLPGGLDKHYNKHVIQENEWGTIITKDEYNAKAINLINSRSGVEVYYQKGNDNLAVYDRTANEFVTGFVTGSDQGIQTLFRPGPVKLPDNTEIPYVDNLISKGQLIRLN